MKTSPKYETIAAALALVGAVALVAVYYPILNPAQFSLDTGRDSAPIIRYIFGTPASLFVLPAVVGAAVGSSVGDVVRCVKRWQHRRWLRRYAKRAS